MTAPAMNHAVDQVVLRQGRRLGDLTVPTAWESGIHLATVTGNAEDDEMKRAIALTVALVGLTVAASAQERQARALDQRSLAQYSEAWPESWRDSQDREVWRDGDDADRDGWRERDKAAREARRERDKDAREAWREREKDRREAWREEAKDRREAIREREKARREWLREREKDEREAEKDRREDAKEYREWRRESDRDRDYRPWP
jgi:hypothetical protein